jgi:NADP-dependent 3-hydroxy acid dehydrogenase YdfG
VPIGDRRIMTGASSGPGAHAVRDLAGLGAHVLAVARRADHFERLARELADAPRRPSLLGADVAPRRRAPSQAPGIAPVSLS